MSTLSQSVPPTRASRTPRTLSLVVLVIGCLVALPLKYAGTSYLVELSTGYVTVDEVTQGNALLAAGDIAPMIALAIFVLLQPVSAARRAVGVVAMVFMVVLDLSTVMGSATLGIEDPLLFGTVMATIFLATSSLAWILARRRSLFALVALPVGVFFGFFFHYIMFETLVDSRNLAPTASQMLSQLILLLSVVAVAWLAVGIDAVVPVRSAPPAASDERGTGGQPVGYTSDGRPVFEYKPNSQ